jgi:hypothetical protein
LYIFQPDDQDLISASGFDFVRFDKKYLYARGGGKRSKARIILEFLEKNKDRAWFSKDIVLNLSKDCVRVEDIMPNVRRFEKKGMVYVRGYRLEERQTPFKEGYLITWIDSTKPREVAINEAVEKTNSALADTSSTSPIMERVHRVMDTVVEHSKLRELVGFNYIHERLKCCESKTKRALERAMQLYPKINKVKLFNAYAVLLSCFTLR